MMRFFSFILLAAALAPANLAAQDGGAQKPAYGILLVSHGSVPAWNAQVSALSRQVDKKIPTETAFGMFLGASEVNAVQGAMDRLARRGVKKIVAVPLFINSDSEVMDQARFTFGLAEKPSETLEKAMARYAKAGTSHGKDEMAGMAMADVPNGDRRVHTALAFALTPALDDHPLLADILLSRARELSSDPSRETVVLVGHGPVDEGMNTIWLATMDRLGAALKSKGGFKAVESATLRDDAPPNVKEKAARELRARVDAASRGGASALVVPLLLASGGIEQHLKDALKGSSYAWNGKMLLPDPRLAEWVLEMGAEGAAQPDKRTYR